MVKKDSVKTTLSDVIGLSDIDSSYIPEFSEVMSIDSDELIENIENDMTDVYVSSEKTNNEFNEKTNNEFNEKTNNEFNEKTNNEFNEKTNNEFKINTKTKKNNNVCSRSDLDGFLKMFVLNTYDIILFRTYQVFNLLLTFMLLSLFTFIRRSLMLALFIMGLISIQLPLVYHHMVETSNTGQVYDMYFIQTGIYYVILSFYSVIVNAYYGDSISELSRIFIYSNIPTIVALACLMISTETAKNDNSRKYSKYVK